MSRIRDRLGQAGSRRRLEGAPSLGQLGWTPPRARSENRREHLGVRDYVQRGVLIGALAWLGWWLVGQVRTDAVPTPPAAAGGGLERVLPSPPPDVVQTDPVAPPVDAPSVPVPVERAPLSPAPPAAAEFPTEVVTPTLSAILVSGARRLAVLDGVVVAAGQFSGAWEVIAVDRDAVLVRHESGVEVPISLGQGASPRVEGGQSP